MKMENTNMNKFVNYLDMYNKKNNMNLLDFVNFMNLSTIHYMNNHYYAKEFVGDTVVRMNPKLMNHAKKQSNQPDPSSNEYRCDNPSSISHILNTTENSYFTLDYYGDSFFNASDLFGDISLGISKTFENTNTTNSKILSLPKTKVHIDVNVQSLSDLIDIIHKYSYSEKEEYNIDLKSLTNIKEELIELNNMIGMNGLKKSIMYQLLYFIQELHVINTNNKDAPKIIHEFKHTVICGPPGTGKTEIAKMIGKMYSKIGILKKNIFKKVTRNDFVAGYLGQTALKTKQVINDCLGGVLFIDEAYSLANGSNENDIYSKECIDVLCESLSDHKDNLMVIIAGYEDELNNTFFTANRGLESRFIWRFKIDDYSSKELFQIFIKKIEETDWVLDIANDKLEPWFEKNKKQFPFFGRDIEQLFTYTKIVHSKRIYGKELSMRKKITIDDLNGGLEMFTNNKKEVKINKVLESMYI
jgi:hypothetical protein